jgi:hypothetical protein
MALHIADTRITSDLGGCHDTAKLRDSGWSVTWLPGRALSQNQAITAMLLAEVYAINPPADHKVWRHVPGWLAEIGLLPSGGDRPCHS